MSEVTQKVQSVKVESLPSTSGGLETCLLDAVSSPVLITGPDSTVVYINPAFSRVTGYSQTEILGKKPPYPWLFPEDLPDGKKDSEIRGLPGEMEKCFRSQDNRRFWVEVRSGTVEDGSGQKYTLETWTDVTGKKRFEAELEDCNLRKLRLNPRDIAGVVIIDAGGNIAFVDSRICRTTGYRREELVGQAVGDYLVREDLPRVMARLLKAKMGVVERGVLKLGVYTRDRRIIQLKTSPQSIKFNGEIAGFIVILRRLVQPDEDEELKEYRTDRVPLSL